MRRLVLSFVVLSAVALVPAVGAAQQISCARGGLQRAVNLYLDAGQNSAGGPWNNFDGTVDWMNVGFGGNDPTRYDFGI